MSTDLSWLPTDLETVCKQKKNHKEPVIPNSSRRKNKSAKKDIDDDAGNSYMVGGVNLQLF